MSCELQEVPLPDNVAAVTPAGVIDPMEATDSGLLDATERNGVDAAFAGFGATVAVSAGTLKSKVTEVVVESSFAAASEDEITIDCGPPVRPACGGF